MPVSIPAHRVIIEDGMSMTVLVEQHSFSVVMPKLLVLLVNLLRGP